MVNILSLVLSICAGLVAIPIFFFLLEVIVAVIVSRREFLLPSGRRQRLAVVVPAHDESAGLLATLEDIKGQLQAGDRLVVVADNCTDDTAKVAAAAGAEVTERHDPTKIGKGYALAWGVRHLSVDPPEIAIFIDADCRVANESLDQLAAACATTGRPAQGLDLMTAPDHLEKDYRVAIFAFRVKNWVRPLGLRALGLPCQLMGTGMAFPWKVIISADLASGLGVEDLKLGIDLARAGHAPVFCPSAVVTSQFPSSVAGAETQRKRWEQGHLGLILRTMPWLAFESLYKGNLALLALTVDAAIPPLTLLGMLVAVMVALACFGAIAGLSMMALAISIATLSAYFIAILLCWGKFGRDVLPAHSIWSMGSYVVGKLPLYRQIFSRRGSQGWIRTDRDKIKR